MTTKQKVIGQTGRVALSDEAIQYKLSRKRTVRYWYVKCAHGYRAEVVGPFHSRTYGACGFGTTKKRAKQHWNAIWATIMGISASSCSRTWTRPIT